MISSTTIYYVYFSAEGVRDAVRSRSGYPRRFPSRWAAEDYIDKHTFPGLLGHYSIEKAVKDVVRK